MRKNGRRQSQWRRPTAPYSTATFATSAGDTVMMLPTSMPRRCSAPCGALAMRSTVAAADTAYTTPMTASWDTRRSRLRVRARTRAPSSGGAQPERVRHRRLQGEVEEERRGGPERRDLGEGDVDEHDLAGQHVDAEVRVDAREDQAHEEGRPEQREEIGHCRALPTSTRRRGR